MSPLLENEDWSRGPDVPLPSFLRDDPADIPGPADVSFTFRVQGPSYERIAPPTRSAHQGYPAGHTYAMPVTPQGAGGYGYSDSTDLGPIVRETSYAGREYSSPYRGSANPGMTYQETAYPRSAYPDSAYPDSAYPGSAYPDSAYSETAYPGPACPETAYPAPEFPASEFSAAYGEPAYGGPATAETDGPVSSVWDPLFDPWPPPGTGPTAGEPGWPLPGQPAWDQLPSDHPSGPLPRTSAGADWPAAPPDDFDVTLTGALGYADLGFRGGRWFSLGGSVPRAITTREALRAHPELGGPIVQVACWWMRENSADPRALDLATELALAVGELSREAAGLVR